MRRRRGSSCLRMRSRAMTNSRPICPSSRRARALSSGRLEHEEQRSEWIRVSVRR
ncbi:hypothetical protein ACFPRL_34785 [Pseudoclavibacter helvolus]